MPVSELLSKMGLAHTGPVHHNLSTPALYEEAIRRREGWVAHLGALVVRTGQYTGRSAEDKFVVREPSSEADIWWSKYNAAIEPERFEGLRRRLEAYLQGRDVYVQDGYAGADPRHRRRVRIVTEQAWHNMFARNMFLREFDPEILADFEPDITVLQCPGFHAIPDVDGTRSEVFIILNFAERLVIIGGTSYAGEIKKSVFSTLNFLLPAEDVFPMHCSANVGRDGDTAIFFGLSGTGKTTLSADPTRRLIGDDEHGWSDDGVFNFEGGCYAKVIRLDPDAEPEIYETTRRFGTVLENVALDFDTRRLDLDDDSLTENTRASYPIMHIPNIVREGTGGPPRNVIMLTADAFGVLPPIARLSPEQAMYYFISGYTAKVAGTERGVTEPTATFSPCFGAPFMTRHPTVYADLFGRYLASTGASVWLVNTGWTGGPYGTGSRISIKYSRAVIDAALTGALADVDYRHDPVFGFDVPESCPGVPSEVLDPQRTWADSDAYASAATDLASRFADNFTQYSDLATSEIRTAGPKAG
jgi:phosphoenolpyruvate carboxykinase (ATP)